MRTDVVAVLATGPSMSAAVAAYVRDRCRTIAVCDAYRLAPWAEALVAVDRVWWRIHPEAQNFAGVKYTAGKLPGGSMKLEPSDEFPADSNSGYRAMGVARERGAKLILLCGFDMRGTHFFGLHAPPLRNTTLKRFRAQLNQFERWLGGCDVLNCTPGSALTKFPYMPLEEALA